MTLMRGVVEHEAQTAPKGGHEVVAVLASDGVALPRAVTESSASPARLRLPPGRAFAGGVAVSSTARAHSQTNLDSHDVVLLLAITCHVVPSPAAAATTERFFVAAVVSLVSTTPPLGVPAVSLLATAPVLAVVMPTTARPDELMPECCASRSTVFGEVAELSAQSAARLPCDSAVACTAMVTIASTFRALGPVEPHAQHGRCLFAIPSQVVPSPAGFTASYRVTFHICLLAARAAYVTTLTTAPTTDAGSDFSFLQPSHVVDKRCCWTAVGLLLVWHYEFLSGTVQNADSPAVDLFFSRTQ